MNYESDYIIPDEFPPDLLDRRKRLDPLGITDYAWNRADALDAGQVLCDAGFAVLGGDVFEITHEGAKPTLDNWYCNATETEQASLEGWMAFVRRAWNKGKDYISHYPEADKKQYVYSLVWTSKKQN